MNNINWVLVFVIGILLAYGLRGKKEGLIRTIFGMFSLIVALTAASIVGPELSKTIKSNDKVLPYLSQKVDAKSLTLPELLKEAVINKKGVEEYKEMAAKKAEELIQIQIANWMINALAFVLVFLLVWILLGYACTTLNIISKLPIINGLNKTAGVVAGIMRGFITIWFWCIVLTIFSATKVGQTIFAFVNQSEFLGLLYNNNLLFEFGKIFL
ncbi:MAG: CvpA family protein [Acetivibrio sp.]